MDVSASLPFSGPLQLPTKMQALKLFWFIRDGIGRHNSCNLTNGQIQGIVAKVIERYWSMAGYETVDHSPAVRQVKRIVDDYQKLLKSKTKNQPKAVRDRSNFLSDLKCCLDIGKTGLRESLRKDRVRVNLGIASEDVQFYDDQFGPRVQAMSHKLDTEFAKRKADNLKRKLSSVPQPGPSSAEPSLAVDDSSDDEEIDHQDNDEEYVDKSRKEKRSEMITVRVPKNVFMSPELISALDRCKTSDYAVMRTFSKLFKQFETQDGKRIKLTDFVMSRSSIRKARIEQRNGIAETEKVKFQSNMPRRLAFGWDGKMLKDMMNIKHEMEAMVLSGAPGYIEGKLIDVIELTDEDGNPTSTGLAQAEASFMAIVDWGADDNIVAFNFDTTASNTGQWSGAAIRLNQYLNRPILYLACRHHIFDLLAKNTFHQVVGYDPSPDVAMFKKFKEIFPHINTSGPFQKFDVDNKDELIELFTNILTKKDFNGNFFVRKDYRQLCVISLVMVGGELPGDEVMRFVAPGACHKARFMAFALNSFKMLAWCHLPEVKVCFSKKVKGQKQLVFEEETLKKLWRWGHFAVKFYVPQFLLATLGRDAPGNDLNLYQSLIQYREVDEELADSALETLSRHTWYLTEYVVLFSLFSDNTTEEEKVKIVERLLTLKDKDSVPSLGHPDFPTVTAETELWDLVTPRSWQFFDIVKSDPVWLTQSVSEWESDPDYLEIKEFVSTVKVVNDSCERAVALATDYVGILTKDSSMRRKILQVVEADRRAYTDCNKATLAK